MLYENKKELIKARKQNARLYPIYKMCSWDLLFYYAISFVFLVQTKGFTPAEVMLTDAIYTIFKLILNIPASAVIERIGKRKSLILANSLLSLYIVLIIVIKGMIGLIFAYFLMAFCFSIKNVAESNLLYDSVTQKNGKGMFAKLEELGARNYYFLDGISSILTGFLYVFNGYLPMIISLIFTLIAIIISCKFKEIIEPKADNDKNIKYRFINYKEEIKCAFKFIFGSKRLRALIIFEAILGGLIYSSYTLRESLLNELIKPEFFAVIISGLTIVSGIFSILQKYLHEKFKNRALTVIVCIYVPTFVLIGILLKLNIIKSLLIAFILILYLVQYAMQSPYHILCGKYERSFASSKMRNKIAVAFDLVKSLSQFIIAFSISVMLTYQTIESTFFIVGIEFLIILFIVLIYMRKRVGLKPEAYTKKDIEVLNPKD